MEGAKITSDLLRKKIMENLRGPERETGRNTHTETRTHTHIHFVGEKKSKCKIGPTTTPLSKLLWCVTY